MSEWAQCSVGQLCDAGFAELQTGPFGTQLHAYDYVASGVPVVPTEALRGRQIDRSVLPEISPSKAEELKRHKLRIGDILFARRGVQATGHIGYVREGEVGFICGTGAIRLRVTDDNPKISSDFLSHVLANPASIQWFKFHAIGATMPNLNEGIIRTFRLSVPPLDEQRRIAVILNALDDKIELNRHMNETLEAMARALFKDWFVDFGPVHAKMEGRRPYLTPDLWEGFPDTLDEEAKPAGWERALVSDVACHVKGTITPSDFPDEIFDHHSIPAYDAGQMPARDSGDVILSNKTEVPEDAVLLSKLNPEIPRVWLTAKPGRERQVCSTEFLVFCAKEGIGTTWLYLLFTERGFRERLQGMVTGTSKSHQRVSPMSVLGAEVAVAEPGSAVLRGFSGTVDPMLERVLQNREESRTLAVTRDLLLPKLMSGEIRLRDAEKVVESVA